MRPRSWTDDQLRAAVATSTRLIDVLRRLDLSIGGATLDAVRNRIIQLGLDCSHMERPPRSPKWDRPADQIRTSASHGSRRSWTDEDLCVAVEKSRSIRGVLVELDLKIGGSQYVNIKRHIMRLGLDTSHFTGQGWTRGMTGPVPRLVRPLEEILVANSDYLKTATLRKRLLREGLKEHRCEGCGLSQWRGQPIPLQLDHINGDRTDNRLVNLRLLCPNCHALTDTYCGKNIGRAASTLAATMSGADAPVEEAGRLEALKKPCPQGREGSNPSRSTAAAALVELLPPNGQAALF
jgi:hypothetical protein